MTRRVPKPDTMPTTARVMSLTIREWIPSVLDDVADGDELGIEVIVVGLRVSVPVPTLDVGII